MSMYKWTAEHLTVVVSQRGACRARRVRTALIFHHGHALRVGQSCLEQRYGDAREAVMCECGPNDVFDIPEDDTTF